ncbi:MAG: 50S ribosomal protein L18e [Candidatus Anstonellales archaeon]
MNIENAELLDTINTLKKDKRPFWRAVLKLIEKPRRKRVVVNLEKIEKFVEEGKTVIVPGKVLGNGTLTKKIVVAAFSYSKKAKQGIENIGGKAISIKQAHNEIKNFQDVMIIV